MHKTWRMYLIVMLLGACPQLGCHQLPGDKSVKDLTPIEQKAGTDKKQELTAAEITQTWVATADKLEKDGKSGEAIALCEKMREPGSPQATQATRKIALLYDRLNDLDKAEPEYQRLLQQNPQDADALRRLGYLSCRRGQWGTAEKHLRQALALNPNDIDARVDLAMTLAQQGYNPESVEEFAKVLPKAEAHCKVAFVMKLQGKLREAVREYEQALAIDPTMQRARTELANLRMLVLADPATPITTMHDEPSRRGTVEAVNIPSPVLDVTGRQMNTRPTLPPTEPPDR
jgi:tetratricopeptide (TPR) repeat protein